MMKYAELVLNVPLNGTFTYISEDDDIVPGLRASVLFGRRKMTGFIVAVSDTIPKNCTVEANKLKKIDRIIDKEPVFTEEQITFLKYCSSLLPLVRQHEFFVIKQLLQGDQSRESITYNLYQNIVGCKQDEIEHTLKFMVKKGALRESSELYSLNVQTDEDYIDHLNDLLDYGLAQYEMNYKNSETFLLWHNYRMDQVQLKLLKDPDHNQKGTYFYGDEAIVFASLKKDASVEERLAYKDKFLAANTFQWECENNISANDLKALRLCKYVHLFVRKVSNENGIQLPFTYVGEGKFTNERPLEKTDSSTGKINRTYLYDIPMEVELPEYLKYDFGVAM